MRKFYTLIFLMLILYTFSMKAQNLSYSCSFPSIVADTNLQTTHVMILNNKSTGINVQVKRDESMKYLSHESYFCWGPACYPPFVSVSAQSSLIASGGKDSTFRSYLNPHGAVGISEIRYCFYDQTNTNDSISILLTYDIRANAINEIKNASQLLSDPYPNPSNNFSIIQYQLPSNEKECMFRIIDQKGKIIRAELCTQKNGIIYINTSEFSKGIYFYSLSSQQKTFSVKKILVL